ncbi:MAG: DNA primase, partial [Gammaproteobacteria bacterium]|nr:DNA primase [Gammaproteobacteria bacterium]NNL50464.1 DNA primase [Woeseiaceae bacterium]
LENALPHIREGRQIRFVFLPEGHDPDSFVNEKGTDAFVTALDAGVELSEFLIQELSSQVDMETVDGRARLAELARPLVQKIPAGVYKELLIESLAGAVGLTAAKLEKMMAGGARQGGRSTVRFAAAARKRKRPSGRSQPSIVRHAVAIVLNHPRAAENVDLGKVANVDRPGIDLLRALIETVRSEPNISTAGLLERWRHDEQGRYLGRLAAAEIPVDDEFDPAAELQDCLARLAIAGRKERIDFLIEKQQLSGLSDEEKSELRALN